MTTEWMDDAVAVVTGAGSGIGRALALRFARHGMSVMLADIDAEGLAETESLIAELGTPVASRIVDVSDAAQVEALAEATVSEFGRVNIVCNNAGVSGGGLSWEVPLEDWQWTIGVNLWGVIHGVRSFVPRRRWPVSWQRQEWALTTQQNTRLSGLQRRSITSYRCSTRR